MNKSWRYILLFLIVPVAVILCAILIGSQMDIRQFVGDHPEAAAGIADRIVHYRLPEGYVEQGGRDIGVLKMVFLTSDGLPLSIDERVVILITTYPTVFGLSEAEFRQELIQAFLRSTDEVTSMTLVSETPIVIQGEPEILYTHESFIETDRHTRILLTSTFEGVSEETMLVIAGPIASWDDQLVNRFIDSIRKGN